MREKVRGNERETVRQKKNVRQKNNIDNKNIIDKMNEVRICVAKGCINRENPLE